MKRIEQWEKALSLSFSLFNHPSHFIDYATKNRKTIRKKINTKNILIINHLLDDMLFRYLSKAPCAPSTFATVSSMFSSILKSKHHSPVVHRSVKRFRLETAISMYTASLSMQVKLFLNVGNYS